MFGATTTPTGRASAAQQERTYCASKKGCFAWVLPSGDVVALEVPRGTVNPVRSALRPFANVASGFWANRRTQSISGLVSVLKRKVLIVFSERLRALSSYKFPMRFTADAEESGCWGTMRLTTMGMAMSIH